MTEKLIQFPCPICKKVWSVNSIRVSDDLTKTSDFLQNITCIWCGFFSHYQITKKVNDANIEVTQKSTNSSSEIISRCRTCGKRGFWVCECGCVCCDEHICKFGCRAGVLPLYQQSSNLRNANIKLMEGESQ